MKLKKCLNIFKKSKWHYMKMILLFYLLYFLVFGVIIFAFPPRISDEYKSSRKGHSYYSDGEGPDRGIIMDSPLNSGLARLRIIEHAKESLDIAYYAIEIGESSDLFFAGLLDAADRGVEVNLLLDGMFHRTRKSFAPFVYISMHHPKLNIKFYEPFNPLMPWTINNRMHDKYIIADNEIAMLGGRNIGDKYFAPEWYEDKISHDRDLIIINTDLEDKDSSVYQMSEYFDEIWNHKYSKSIKKLKFMIREKRAEKKYRELKEKYAAIREYNKEILEKPIDLMEASFPTNKISFIHNPITRFSKDPWVWYEIVDIMSKAKESIFIQSPYVVPSRHMIKHYLKDMELDKLDITILTNSLGSTPNLPAFSGYLNYRKKIIDNDIRVFEYQSIDSLHTKAYAVDEDLFAIGTFNLDSRSTFLSTESMAIVHSREGALELEKGLMEYMDESLEVDEDYGYQIKDGVEKLPVSSFKRNLFNLTSFIARWLEFLL